MYIKKWINSDILALIEVYKTKMNEFESAKTYLVVWNSISNILNESNIKFSAIQCKWKFTRLKTDILQKVDNMKKSGAPTYSFKYFDSFDGVNRPLFINGGMHHSNNGYALSLRITSP